MNSFYNESELRKLGFKKIGKNVMISRKASIYSPDTITIGNNVRIDDFCILSGNIEMGSHIHISAYVALYGKNGIFIEDFVGISTRSSVFSESDDYSGESLTTPVVPASYRKTQGGAVYIHKYSLIGSSSIVLPGVTVKEGCSFGCFSLINHDPDPWSINVGIPFHKIGDRKKDLLKCEKQFLREYEI